MKKLNKIIMIVMLLIAVNVAYAENVNDDSVAVEDTISFNLKFQDLKDPLDRSDFIKEINLLKLEILKTSKFEELDDSLKLDVVTKINLLKREVISTNPDSLTLGETLDKIRKTVKDEHDIDVDVEDPGDDPDDGDPSGGRVPWSYISIVIIAIIICIVMWIKRRKKRLKKEGKRAEKDVLKEEDLVEKLEKLLLGKRPLIRSNADFSVKIADDLELVRNIRSKINDKTAEILKKKYEDDWLFKIFDKKFQNQDKKLIAEQVKDKGLLKEFEEKLRKGFNMHMLEKNIEAMQNKNKDIVNIMERIIKVEKDYDKHIKKIKIMIGEEFGKFEDFFNKIIIWRERNRIHTPDLDATNKRLDDLMAKMKEDKTEGAEEFVKEVKKSVFVFHLKQQMINAIEKGIEVRLPGEK